MGYTHYVSVKTDDNVTEDKIVAGYAAALPTLQDIAHRYKDILCFEYDDVNTPAEVTLDRIRFNGKGEDGHETFFFEPIPTEFSCCKTARKAYDLPVCEVLLALATHVPGMELGSDGFYMDFEYDESGGVIAGLDENWRQALEEVEKRYGIRFSSKVERSPANYTLKDGKKAEYRKVILQAA